MGLILFILPLGSITSQLKILSFAQDSEYVTVKELAVTTNLFLAFCLVLKILTIRIEEEKKL